jgi:hypothetical protein
MHNGNATRNTTIEANTSCRRALAGFGFDPGSKMEPEGLSNGSFIVNP